MRHLVPLRRAAFALLLAGCAPASLPPDTAPALFGGGLPVAPVSVAAGPFDGLYTGTAVVEVNPEFGCTRQIPVGGFRVDGNAVRFGAFRGTVAPDGSATLLFGYSTMVGRFADNGFQGRIALYPMLQWDKEACVYRASLGRVAG